MATKWRTGKQLKRPSPIKATRPTPQPTVPRRATKQASLDIPGRGGHYIESIYQVQARGMSSYMGIGGWGNKLKWGSDYKVHILYTVKPSQRLGMHCHGPAREN